jgi:putative hemolysin
MELVKPKDLIDASPALNYFGGEFFTRFLMYVFRFQKLNDLYTTIYQKSGIEFIDAMIEILQLKIGYDNRELRRIPEKGPVIVVANHPLGGLDGLLLIKLVSEVRKDLKIVAGPLLKKIEPVADFFIETNPFENHISGKDTTFSGLKEAVQQLKNGGVLCIFPAGETPTYDPSHVITDNIWRYPVMKFIKKVDAPVVPVLFKANYSRLYKIFCTIHPRLKDLRFPSEILGKRFKNIRVRIGNPIRQADQDKFCDVYQFGRYLRAKTYCMATPVEVKRFFSHTLKPVQKPDKIVDAIDGQIILKEIQEIRSGYLLFRLKEYCVFCAPAANIPNILLEIGRLREITFREVGEGSLQSLDVDEYDLYYRQMFIWDENASKIVGAYRIGMGREIMQQYGKRGFYLHSLFRLHDDISGILNQSLELGRSFVVKEYQRKPMSLFLLWKGILYFILKNPEYRFLMGPVSISNNYAKISKELIIKFIMANHFDWKIAQKIRPRNSYKFRTENPDLKVLMETMEHDINKLDKIIGDVDALNSGLPVLLKKYIKLNARIAGFNVDPKFNNCLDGLIILDIYDVPRNIIESLSKEVNDGSLLERFYSSRE